MTAFTPHSRYAGMPSRAVMLGDGRTVTLVDAPHRVAPVLAGYHPRADGQRPDHLAAVYLSDPTAAWRLYDAGAGATPEAVAARTRVAVPRKEG